MGELDHIREQNKAAHREIMSRRNSPANYPKLGDRSAVNGLRKVYYPDTPTEAAAAIGKKLFNTLGNTGAESLAQGTESGSPVFHGPNVPEPDIQSKERYYFGQIFNSPSDPVVADFRPYSRIARVGNTITAPDFSIKPLTGSSGLSYGVSPSRPLKQRQIIVNFSVVNKGFKGTGRVPVGFYICPNATVDPKTFKKYDPPFVYPYNVEGYREIDYFTDSKYPYKVLYSGCFLLKRVKISLSPYGIYKGSTAVTLPDNTSGYWLQDGIYYIGMYCDPDNQFTRYNLKKSIFYGTENLKSGNTSLAKYASVPITIRETNPNIYP